MYIIRRKLLLEETKINCHDSINLLNQYQSFQQDSYETFQSFIPRQHLNSSGVYRAISDLLVLLKLVEAHHK
jgi:hypothetical protein